jgi:hypothetical protein
MEEYVQLHIRLLKMPIESDHGKVFYSIAEYFYQQNDILFLETGIEAV